MGMVVWGVMVCIMAGLAIMAVGRHVALICYHYGAIESERGSCVSGGYGVGWGFVTGNRRGDSERGHTRHDSQRNTKKERMEREKRVDIV